MKLVWINVIAIIIAISSLVVERPSVQADFSLPAAFSIESHLQFDDIRNDSVAHHEKNSVIAQDFIPIVVIADEPNADSGFLHYLPLYNLQRPKDYFLLI